MDDGAPRLPQDVERLIFRAAASAADNDVKGMARLLLVAKRVCEWIRPILYQVFKSSTLSRFPDFRGDPSILGEVGKFAKHLSIGNSTTSEDLIRLLLSCPNIEDIAIWHGQVSLYYPALHLFPLPLKRLSHSAQNGIYVRRKYGENSSKNLIFEF
ncbi:hypothetical protein GALMADRAFT_146793 [Galerina marginata CBS 339.88]|uniref:F-box domain-containing protein n=1 Tax=Galerina marginata (strain CBS 339.88) TaxID=685588 RepID=A0A067SCQ7_GALM3|nr:hypothetical protein GALMADRAFT_146793 [Galerina marginata CBS 339.88]